MGAPFNTLYDNFFLENEVEDQFVTHLDLSQFCTIDTSLDETEGMVKKIHVYSATDAAENLEIGEGNSNSVVVSYTKEEYRVKLVQDRFQYYDEEALTDPVGILVGTRKLGTDMFNKMNKDVFAEMNKADLTVEAVVPDFNAFVDAQTLLNLENLEDVPVFCLINPNDKGNLRKALKEDLKYVEAFSRNGYIGTVAGINVYTSKQITVGTQIVATKEAVTLFVKGGTEVEQSVKGNRDSNDANVRKNTIITRKRYLAALTDKKKIVKIVKKSSI